MRHPTMTVWERHHARLRAEAVFAAAVHSLSAEPVAANVVRYLVASRALEATRWERRQNS